MTFLVLGFLLTVALLTFIGATPSFGMLDGKVAKNGAHSAVGMTLAGAFGAVPSALAPGRASFSTGVPYFRWSRRCARLSERRPACCCT